MLVAMNSSTMVDIGVQVAGWAGSALIIVSLKQNDPARFRWLNLVASGLLGLFALTVHAWPSVTVNLLSVVINAQELRRLDPRVGDVHADATALVGEPVTGQVPALAVSS